MRPSRSCNLLFIAASSTPGAGNPEDGSVQGAGRASGLPDSCSPAPGWQLTLRPPPRSARPGEVAPRPQLTRPLALSPRPLPQRPASLPRCRRLTPSERSPPNVTNQPPKRSSGSLATGAARLPATDGVGGPTAQLEMTTTRCFCLLTPATQNLRCLLRGQLSTLECGITGSKLGVAQGSHSATQTGEQAAEEGNVKGHKKVAQTGPH